MHDVRRPLVSQVRVKMKSGKEEQFDVKYERPPLFCFVCGRVGHGSKDCDEDEEDPNQEIKFGGWLKASPWKVGEARDTYRAGSGTSSCAKALFITKPKRGIDEQNQEKVSEVVEKLNQWDIGESQRLVQKEIKSITLEHQEEGGSMIEASSGHTETQVDDNRVSMDKLGEVPIITDGLEGGKVTPRGKKGWKRREGKGSGPKMETLITVGQKRNDRTINEMGLDELELQEMRYFKKVGVDNGGNVEANQCTADEKVAGPTNRALGGQ